MMERQYTVSELADLAGGTSRRFFGLTPVAFKALCCLVLLEGTLFGAGPKQNVPSGLLISDDLTGASGGSAGFSGAGYSGVGAAVQAGTVKMTGAGPSLSAGFFAFAAQAFPECLFALTVKAAGGENHTTIQAAVDALGGTLEADTCIVIKDSAVYNEQVTIQNIANNGSRLTIMKDPAVGTSPTVNPPALSTAAFVVKNASVTIAGITIAPTASVSYGIRASSQGVTISSVVVTASGVNIAVAGISLSTGNSLSYSMINVQNASAVEVLGSSGSVSYSTMTANVDSSPFNRAALFINGGSSNTVLESYAYNQGGVAAFLHSNANGNTIAKSSMASALAGSPGSGLYIYASASNTVTKSFITATFDAGAVLDYGSFNQVNQSTISGAGGGFRLQNSSFNVFGQDYMAAGSGQALIIQAGSHYNSVSQSTIAGTQAGAQGVFIGGSSSNTIANSLMSAVDLPALEINFSYNTISQSTMTNNSASQPAVEFFGSGSFNTISGSYFRNPAGSGARFQNAANGNTISQSTVASASGGEAAAILIGTSLGAGCSSNTVTGSFVSNPAGTGIRISTGSGYNKIIQSTVTSGATGAMAALYMTGSTNTVTNSYFENLAGYGAHLYNSNLNVIQQSTVTGGGSGYPALYFNSSSTNTFAQGLIRHGGSGWGMKLENSNYNTISQSDISINTCCYYPLAFSLAGVNTITQTKISNPGGYGVEIRNGSNLNVISQSTITANSASDFAGGGVRVITSSTNTFTQCFISDPGSYGVDITNGSEGNSVIGSTLVGNLAGARIGVHTEFGSPVNVVGNSVDSSYVQGSTAVHVSGSTGTAIKSSVLVATALKGNGIGVSIGVVGLAGSANDVKGGAEGAGIFLNAASQGVLRFSTNVIKGARYGFNLGPQSSGAVIVIASNTVIQTLSTSFETYGIYANGLNTGATIQENAFVHRTPGSMGAFLSYGLWARNSPALRIWNNRFSNPGMISGGGFTGVSLNASPQAEIEFNDFHSTGSAATAYLLNLENGSNLATIKNNVFSASMTVTGSSATIRFTGDSTTGHLIDYNNYFSSNSRSTAFWGAAAYDLPAAWNLSTGHDLHARSVHPLWLDPSAGPMGEDFHPRSTAGRWSPALGAFTSDGATAKTIDGAHPAAVFARETTPNGGRANMGSYGNTEEASKSPSPVFSRLQILMPGEAAAPDTITGRSGQAQNVYQNIFFQVTVRGTDDFWNGVSAAADPVKLTTAAPFSSNNLPQAATLAAGSTIFFNVSLGAVGGGVVLVASNTAVDMPMGQTPPFSVVPAVPPTLGISIPPGSARATLGGSISGGASDGVAVSTVVIAIQRKDNGASTGYFWDWGAKTFSLGAPQFNGGTLNPPNAPVVDWAVPFLDSDLADMTSYYVIAKSSNPAQLFSIVETTFTFNSQLALAPKGDGEGTAVVLPDLTEGCQPIISTVVFTVGWSSITAGGMVAVRIPDGWTRPQARQFVAPAALLPGELTVGATTAVGVELNPARNGNTTLGDNWIGVTAVAKMDRGNKIFVTYKGFPPSGGLATSSQTFAVMSRASPPGTLVAITTAPAFSLTPGGARRLAFSPAEQISVGPLQTSPTMQVVVTDACGVSTNTIAAVDVSLFAGNFGALDSNTSFYASGTGLELTTRKVTIGGGASAAPGFYYRTSTSGVSFELLRATATLGGTIVEASRFVRLFSSTIGISGVSVDSGTLTPGALSATMTGNTFLAPSFVNFRLSDSSARWEVIISSSSADFYPEVFRRFGSGDPGRTVSWNGVNERIVPARSMAPGEYFVKIVAEGGVAVERSARIYISTKTGSIYGTVNSTGASAAVFAFGPGSHFGQSAAASSTGYFQIHGLEAGKAYNVEASTAVLDPVYRRFTRLTVSSLSVTAAAGGVDIGTIPFPTPSTIRVTAAIATLAPRELFGRVKAYNSDYSRVAFGTLHFSSGSSGSDDGGQSFGGAPSTWTVLSTVGGTYDLDVSVAELGLSTTVKSLTVAAGASTDVVVNLDRKANLYGYAVLPGTVPFGSWVSVQGARAGDTAPSLFGGAFIKAPGTGVNPTSATYSLFGLSPGSWTISARTFGFLGVSSAVYISSDADVGNPVSGGFNLFLSSGGVLRGTITVAGDTSGLAASLGGGGGGPGFDLFVNAFNPAAFSKASVRIRLSTSSTVTSSTFSLSGLEDGTQFVSAHLPGFVDLKGTATISGGQGLADYFMKPNDARIFLTVHLPAGNYPPSEFRKVSLLVRGPGVRPVLRSDLVGANTVQYFASSATWQSPPLSAGVFGVEALYGPTGMYQVRQAALTQGATAELSLDLGASTYSVKGTLSLSGNIIFSKADYSVNVSSIAGLLSNAGATGYCLMGSSLPVTTTTAHMELIPAHPLFGGFLSGPLFRAPPGPFGCFSPSAGEGVGPNSPNPFHGYIAEISTTGVFAFKGVPPGLYLLRNNAEIDNNTANGDELPQLRRFVSVASDTVIPALQLDSGFSVSGSLLAPPQVLLSRPFRVSLLDSAGNVQRTVVTSFNNSPQARYFFDRVAAGAYAIRVEDQGYPRAFAGRPRSVKVQTFNLSGEDIALVQGGIIKGKLAIQQRLPDGTTGPLQLITNQSAQLLPKNFQVAAVSNPWFQGGTGQALPKNCGGSPCGGIGLDSADQFVIDNLLPGTYDVKFISRNNTEDTQEGGINLVSSFAPGVKIDEGKVTDIGTMKLSAALDLRGKVTSGGAAVSNVKIEARPSVRQASDRDRILATTDKDGGYVLSGLDPRIRFYDVVAASRGSGEQGEALSPYERKTAPSVDLSSTTSLDFSLTAAPYSIKGKISAASGSAALAIPFGDAGRTRPGARIFLLKSGDIPKENPTGDVILNTDREGNFELAALAAGTYRLTIVALDHGSLVRNVTITDSSVDLGALSLSAGGSLTGSIKKPDGSSPSSAEVQAVAAATGDFTELVLGSLTKDPNTKTVTDYAVSGFKAGLSYRLVLIDSKGVPFSPSEASAVVFTSTETRNVDVVYRQPKPSVFAKAKRKSDGTFAVVLEMSQPLRARTAADDALSVLFTTYSAQGTLSQFELVGDRSRLAAVYTPGGGETTFSLRLNAFSALTDPDSLDPVNPEYPLRAISTFYLGLDGLHRNAVSNFSGGNLIVEGDNGRVTMPSGAFAVDASSTIDVTLHISSESLAKHGVGVLGLRTKEERNIASLRYAPSAYPESLLRAMAATPPEISPFSAFYDILLPLGIRTALAKPVQMTISYSTGTDPTTVNLYWYNSAANAYILQQDVTGASPVIDYENHTITLNVNHFSTFVMFQTNVNVITGDTFGASEMEAYSFPNPFDLSVKTVTTIHPAASHTVRGTLVRFSLPLDVSGAATLRVLTLSGERIRTIDLGDLAAGRHYYQAWDGRNDSGRDVASGIYIGQIKVGKRTKFFKMAVVK